MIKPSDRVLILDVVDRNGRALSGSVVTFFVNEQEIGTASQTSASPFIQIPRVNSDVSVSIVVENNGAKSTRRVVDPQTSRLRVVLDTVGSDMSEVRIRVVDLDEKPIPAAVVFARLDGKPEVSVPNHGQGWFLLTREASVSFSVRAEFGSDVIPSVQLPLDVTEHTLVLNRRVGAKGWEKVAAVVFGVVFLCLVFVVRLVIQNPTTRLEDFLRTITAIAAAALASIIPGFLEAHIGPRAMPFVRATGAFAVLVIIYYSNPAMREI